LNAERMSATTVLGRWYQPWKDRFDFLFVDEAGGTHWARGSSLTGGIKATEHDVMHEMTIHKDWLGEFSWEPPTRLDVDFRSGKAQTVIDPWRKLQFAHAVVEQMVSRMQRPDWADSPEQVLAGLHIDVESGGHRGLHDGKETVQERGAFVRQHLVQAVQAEIKKRASHGSLTPEQAASLIGQVDSLFTTRERELQHGDHAMARQSHGDDERAVRCQASADRGCPS
jgi:hypothetical protein